MNLTVTEILLVLLLVNIIISVFWINKRISLIESKLDTIQQSLMSNLKRISENPVLQERGFSLKDIQPMLTILEPFLTKIFSFDHPIPGPEFLQKKEFRQKKDNDNHDVNFKTAT